MQADFENALARILVYEGGKVDNPLDPGGRTNKGITQATYNAWLYQQKRSTADVYNIADADVVAIYKGEYWDRVSGDNLSIGLDLVVFDGAVNSGCAQSIKWLQAALGDAYTGGIDGVLGANTMAAVSATSRDDQSLEGLIQAYCSHRLATLQHLRTWSAFGRGWAARVANVQKTACAWVAQAPHPHPVDVTAAGGHQKAPASDIKPSPISQGAAHATTAVTGAGAFASQVVTQAPSIREALPHMHWVTMVLAALTAFSGLSGILVRGINNARDAAIKGSSTAVVNLDADAGYPTVPVTDKKVP